MLNSRYFENFIEEVYKVVDIRPQSFSALRRYFPGTKGYHISLALKRLREEGRVLQIKEGGEVYNYSVKTFADKIKINTKNTIRKLADSFRRGEWVKDDYVAEVSSRYHPDSFSAFLTKYSMEAHGWRIIKYLEWELVEASKGTKIGDVGLYLTVVNASIPKYEGDYDEVKLQGRFRRKKKEDLRIHPIKHEPYVAKVFYNLQEIGWKTQFLNGCATAIIEASKRDKTEADKMVDELFNFYISPIPEDHADVLNPIVKNFFRVKTPPETITRSIKRGTGKALEKHLTHIEYLRKKVKEKISKPMAGLKI